jgi:DNA-binding LacI/PurR family transcriptional regulator
MSVERARTVTIADVARAAQVSTATVSLVVNGQASSLRISEATRQTVLEAVSRLGYTPNHAARSLRRRKTGALALLLTRLDLPYHGELATSAFAAAEERGYDLHILEARSPGHELRLLERLRGGSVDGALVSTLRSPFDRDGRPLLADLPLRNQGRVALAQSGVPVVAMLDHSPDPAVPAVRIDDEGGAYRATRHLIDLGHRQIAYVSLTTVPPADDEHTTSADRYRGYCRALAEAGLPFGASLLVGVGHRPRLQAGHAAGLAWRENPVPDVTAMFIPNDMIAIGVLRGLHEAGIRVPDDIAMVAFDGIEISQYTQPSLTTGEHPRADLGRIGVETLVDLVAGRPPAERDRVLAVGLVVRESCGARRPGAVSTPPITGPGSPWERSVNADRGGAGV